MGQQSLVSGNKIRKGVAYASVSMSEHSLASALRRIAVRGLEINSVIDVGAAEGLWSIEAERHWPHARFHLIEAFAYWRSKLERLVSERPNYSISFAVAGPADGVTRFASDPNNPSGGSAAHDASASTYVYVPMVSIDKEVQRLNLAGPYLVKLDTHGFERPIIEGARNTLRQTNLLVNEFYNYQSEDRRFPQMILFIESLGFGCIDLFEPLSRAHDGALWQFDAAFIPRAMKDSGFQGY
jgi:FkbM family methyltransferase